MSEPKKSALVAIIDAEIAKSYPSDPLNSAADKLNEVTAELDVYLADDTSGSELIEDENAGFARLVSAGEELQDRISDVGDLYGGAESI